MSDIGKNIVKQKIASNCKKSCSNVRYFGDVSGINPVSPPGKKYNWYFFSYILTNDEFITNVFEEYLIYDVIGMIGSVGGTFGTHTTYVNWISKKSCQQIFFLFLGMFIGFSLTGTFALIFSYLRRCSRTRVLNV